LDFSDSVTLEVLIVDNRSTDGTPSLLAGEQRREHRFSLNGLREEQQGQSSAINCGLRNCRGRIICLLDDDVVLVSRWLHGLLESYRTSAFDALQGRVLPGVDPEGRPADPKRLHYYNIPIVDYGEQIRPIRGLTGAHMTFKREVFDKIGFFDVRLGPGASGFSGDTQFSRRAREAGFTIGYTPKAVVYHELDPARYGRKYNRAVQYRKGLSRSLYRRESLLGKVLPELVGNCLKFGIYALAGKTGKLYRAEGRILRGLGYLQGRVQASRNKK
jgi:GT2 family glycosyltransferase